MFIPVLMLKPLACSELSREDVEESLEACRIRCRHDQIDARSVFRADRAVQIDIFANELSGDRTLRVGAPLNFCENNPMQSRRSFGKLHNWLRDNVYRHGSNYHSRVREARARNP